MTIQELQEKVKKDWADNSPGGIPTLEQTLLYMIEEFGEVAEAIRKKDGRKQRSSNERKIGSEMADLLICYMTLANVLDIDVARENEAFWQRLAERHAKGF